MKTWTIKVDDHLDQLVEQLVRELGYTSKAELVRESIRQRLLEVGLSKVDLHAVDRHATARMSLQEALQELLKLAANHNGIKELVDTARDEVEEVVFSRKKPSA